MESPYKYSFAPEDDSTAARVLRQVGFNKYVLELGCAYGIMSKVLNEHYSCKIVGVELDHKSAELAKPYCERLIVADIESLDWDAAFGAERFDVIVAADFIEHLRDPWRCLENIRRFLAVDGYLVLSVPNATHNGIIAELLSENFEYRNVGLLDKTHLRFFGWRSLQKTINNAGYRIDTLEVQKVTEERTEFHESWNKLPNWMKAVLESRPAGGAYQYIIKAIPVNDASLTLCKDPAIDVETGQFDELAMEGLSLARAERMGAEAEAQIKEAKVRVEKAETRAAEAELRASAAEVRANAAEMLTAEAETRASAAGVRANAAEARAAEAETRANTAELLRAEAKSQVVVAENKVAALEAMLALIQSSKSWKLSRPLRVLTRVCRYGFMAEDRQRLDLACRGIYQELPLPPSVKQPLRNLYNRLFRRTASSLRKKMQTSSDSLPPSRCHLAHQHATQPDFIVWGVIDWHFRQQRPQHLSRELAGAGRRVFYISPQMIDDDLPGFVEEPLDAAGQLFQIKLCVKNAPSIYVAAPGIEQIEQLRLSIGEFLRWAGCRRLISMVEHPFWYDVATVLPGCRVIYDCMDHHEGFGNTGEDILGLELALLRRADLTVITSLWLDRIIGEHTPRRAMIRNAAEYKHFCNRPGKVYQDPMGRRVIGYFGAIAHWFDIELVAEIARRFPDYLVLLVGEDSCGAAKLLKEHQNIQFTGEKPYAELPYYLYGFDVCILPFRIIPLTMATNPVKAYEYLSAGKAVVSTDLPEVRLFGDLVQVAADTDSFCAALTLALAEPANSPQITARKKFAALQTWTCRARELDEAVAVLEEPLVSIIVVTYNNLALTKNCLESIETYTDYKNFEVIVVDNASSDETPAYLSDWSVQGKKRHIILNKDNRGFAAANNQGLAVAQGDFLVLLNNDTHVTPGWIRTMVNHLFRDPTIGLIGPVTNNIGNEARIEVQYDTMDEMLTQAHEYTCRHLGQTFSLRTVAFFCVMMGRNVFQKVGPLDEDFGMGFFEDDDYCRRVTTQGFHVVCAEDVFIHHHLSASFNKLNSEERSALFEKNKSIYEAKWGKFIPHRYR